MNRVNLKSNTSSTLITYLFQTCAVNIIHYSLIPQQGHQVRRIQFKFSSIGNGTFLEGDRVFYEYLEKGRLNLVIDTKYPTEEADLDDVWRRAEDRIGERNYWTLFYNCEHFITELLTGKPTSKQINLLKCAGGLILVVSGSLAARKLISWAATQTELMFLSTVLSTAVSILVEHRLQCVEVIQDTIIILYELLL